MSDQHRTDYTDSPALQQDNLGISVNPSRNALSVSVDFPWAVVAFVADSFPCLFRHFQAAIAGHRATIDTSRARKADHAVEAAQKIREFRSIGRLASRLIRLAKSDGLDRCEAINMAAQYFKHEVSTIELMVRHHNQRREIRYKRMRGYRLVSWAAMGLSNAEIGRRLNVTPGYAGKLVKQAIDGQRDAANDR